MSLKILPLIPFVLLAACETKEESTVTSPASREDPLSTKPVIRSISFSGDDEYGGIELKGNRAYRRHGHSGADKTEISYQEGLELLEEFYALPDIERFRGTKDQLRENATHHVVVIYDEKPERYSKDWVDYLIPKDTTDPRIRGWLEKMKRR